MAGGLASFRARRPHRRSDAQAARRGITPATAARKLTGGIMGILAASASVPKKKTSSFIFALAYLPACLL